jgi:hypothetical protein
MRCLFCKGDSTDSRSVEHIIPESLGNHSHVLPRGVVCDRCNNYFSREVEKPFLEFPAMMAIRFREWLPSKRGVVPSSEAYLLPGVPAVIHPHRKGPFIASLELPPESVPALIGRSNGALILPPEPAFPDGSVLSRFMAKAGLEALAARVLDHQAGHEYFVDHQELDLVRDHARRGTTAKWPVHRRRIYDADRQWFEPAGPASQIVHEFDILVTDSNEYYFVLAVFGLELTINLGGPELEGYLAWLDTHCDASPLYSGKNALL